MNRREFLHVTGGVLLGAATMPALSRAAILPGSRKLSDIGLQLYTVRNLMQNDFEGTIEKVAALGYTQLEFAGYYNHAPEDVKALLDRLGVKSPANHTQYNELQPDTLEKSIDSAKTIGQEFVVLPMLPMNWGRRPRRPQNEDAPNSSPDAAPQEEQPRPRGPQFTKDDVLKHAEFMNTVGEACKKADLKFAYHNHSMEFAMVEDEMPMYDMLLQNTDPELVFMELDLYWAVKAGADPLAYFEKYPGRFALCHVKGMANDEQESMTSVGAGKIDFAKIFAQSDKAGLKYYIVEHDNPTDALASISESIAYLKELTF